MIITNIIGGLGNQMFQYAVARALSIKLGVSLKLDVDDFHGYALHQGFELKRLFNSEIEVASNVDKHIVLGWRKSYLMRRLTKKRVFSFIKNKNYIVEPSFAYWSGVTQLNDNVYLDGYWQSYKYFNEFSDTIKADFTFQLPLTTQNKELSVQIAEVNAVSLHVRRGDYVSNTKANATHGVCSLDYYHDAIEHILNHVEEPVFFIFSDDIAWVKDNLAINARVVFIDHNTGKESFNDMRLMRLCQHHIIANSSFSWWGAWLGINDNKIVIAPKKWFAQTNSTNDLIPTNWLTL